MVRFDQLWLNLATPLSLYRLNFCVLSASRALRTGKPTGNEKRFEEKVVQDWFVGIFLK